MNKICLYCKKDFDVKPSRWERTKYCSMECRKLDNSRRLICENCGTEKRVQLTKYNKIINGVQKHFFCSKECRLSYERPSIIELQSMFEKKGYVLLTQNYSNAREKLEYKCKKHADKGSQYISYYNFKTGYGCKYCGFVSMSLKRRNNFEKIHNAFQKAGLDLLEQEYQNSSVPMAYICKQHPDVGIQYKSYSNVLNAIGCPYCNISKGEHKIYGYLKDNFIIFETQKKFKDLLGVGGGNLSYDFFVPKQNLLIEYQGEYHDGTAGNQSLEQYNIQKEHDKRKRDYAKNNGYVLLEVWYYENIEEKLNQYFKNNNLIYA